MLNTASVKAVDRSRFSRNFVRPCYDSYCFSHLPATIRFLLTGQGQSALPIDVFGHLPTRYQKVVFLFLDAFGWRFFERHRRRSSFLQTIAQQGVISKMTSQFPSTTAAHVTCIHTGLDVGQSGVYEWNYYEPLVDALISPLPFIYAGEKAQRDSLTQLPISPDKFFPQQTVYNDLQQHGVSSHVFQKAIYATTAYSNLVFRGATIHPYQSFQQATEELATLLTTSTTGPSYYFLYYDYLDAVCHNYGPESSQHDYAITTCFTRLERALYQATLGKSPDTLLMVTADHGQVEVSASQTWYLNQHYPEITRFLKTNQRGQLLVPAGSARDMFLHVIEEHVDTVVQELRQRLAGRAEVYPTSDLLAQNFFGTQPPSPLFLQRVGNVVILPYKHHAVWWYEENKFAMHFLGHHGGLTPEEMEIPLLLLAL